MLTIGEVARFSGVTVRAVRHYHARGLLPEPPRDASGYRRYDATAAADLVRIRVLAAAGVPLARVGELLGATTGDFARAVEEVDRDLQEQVRRLQEHRAQIAALVSADRLGLPEAVGSYLERLRALGLSEQVVALERESWVLLSVRSPEQVEEAIAHKHAYLDDPALCALYRQFGELLECEPDDPRVPAYADALADYLEHRLSSADRAALRDPGVDATTAGLLASGTVGTYPALRRLGELLEERSSVQE